MAESGIFNENKLGTNTQIISYEYKYQILDK